MNRSTSFLFCILIFFFSFFVHAELVFNTGQPILLIDKVTGSLLDMVESKVCLLEPELTTYSDLICSQIELINTDLLSINSKAIMLESQFEQIESKLPIVDSQLDIIESKLCLLSSEVDILTECAATPITGITTITTPGLYCVAQDLSGVETIVTINTDDVVVDLNHHTLENTAGITMLIHNHDQLAIQNGVILNGTIGINASSGATNIRIDEVLIKGAERGINFENVIGGTISNCTLTQNTTGVQLNNSHKIIFENTIANCNANAGFDLLSSTTCVFTDCKAVSTGEGNTQILDATIFGFASTNGFGNIFERCIANSTQGLTVTGANSLIAGFALRGDERCSKIIDSESANATSNPIGVAVPYGILLEGSMSNLATATLAELSGSGQKVSWTLDGKYLAVAVSVSSNNLNIFTVVNQMLTEIVRTTVSMDLLLNVQWTSDGEYLAVSGQSTAIGSESVVIYKFNKIVQTLEKIASFNHDATTNQEQVWALGWSPDNTYLVSGLANSTDGIPIKLYKLDQISQTITLVDTVTTGITAGLEVAWSPCGNFFAIGRGILNELQLYQVDKMNDTMSLAQSISFTSFIGNVNGLDFSPDGQFLAFGTNSTPLLTDVIIYSFDPTSSMPLMQFVAIAPGGNTNTNVLELNWAPDSQHLAISVTAPSAIVYVYRLDRGAQDLIEVTTRAGIAPSGLEWSPDGSMLAATVSQNILLLDGLHFPSKNVIKNNIVYCNSGGKLPYGVGISGSSIQNLIIGNTAYSNPLLSQGPSGQVLQSSNYQFVTNVFNPLYELAPSALENISIDAGEPICMPDDLGLLLKQSRHKACAIESQFDLFTSLIENLSGGSGCAVTDIAAGPITEEGFYCLSADVSGTLSIIADNVVLDLNRRKVAGEIAIAGSDVKVMNGMVEGSGTGIGNAISATSVSNITLSEVTAKNAQVGVNFHNVTGGTIKNCSLTQNTTGAQFSYSHKIIVDSSTAECNTNAGFDLLTSTTCLFTDCKALSTGEGNTQITDATIIGFVSQNGYGNIFERCIANGTQALSTIDFNSIVAGFALRGSESGSKIIDSESANATTAPDGVTVPYGILLKNVIDSSLTITAVAEPDVVARSITWRKDGEYIAVGDDAGTLSIFSFDRTSFTLTRVAYDTSAAGSNIFYVDWSPDGLHIATASTNTDDRVRVYKFESINNRLTLVAADNVSEKADDVRAAVWSPDGRYLAVIAVNPGSSAKLRIFSFNLITEELAIIQSDNPSGSGRSVSWRPDGKYLSVGTNSAFYIYSFINNTLSFQVSDVVIGRSSAWTPNGQFVANGTGSGFFRIYEFSEPNILSTLLSQGTLSIVTDVDWSSDGSMLVTSDFSSTNRTSVYLFDQEMNVTQIAVRDNPGSGNGNATAKWSPDGQFIAHTSSHAGKNPSTMLYTALTFPSKNVIKNNTVYCNSGAKFPSGIGISGSSIANMIIGNTSYSNPLPQMTEGGGPVVFTNYVFCTNVFNPLFEFAPNSIQNIALGGCEPICTPQNVATLLKQAYANINDLAACAPTAISAGTTLSTPGNYILCEDITGDIAITTTCVSLDLNDRCLTGAITVATSDNVIIKNGYLLPSAPTANGQSAIIIEESAVNTTIKKLTISCTDAVTAGREGRTGISIAGNDTQVLNCVITSGAGANHTGASAAGNGGAGIALEASSERTLIKNCSIVTGNGGNTGSGTAGDGGVGIFVDDNAQTGEIVGCTIVQTGNGGTTSGTVGDGGHGIFISDGAIDISVRDNVIRNTGIAGGGSGIPGKAIFDLVITTANDSIVFSNFAHNIANPTKFDLQAPSIAGGPEDGVLSPNPPDGTVLNPFANIFTTP